MSISSNSTMLWKYTCHCDDLYFLVQVWMPVIILRNDARDEAANKEK
jgi:hypothetical protein